MASPDRPKLEGDGFSVLRCQVSTFVTRPKYLLLRRLAARRKTTMSDILRGLLLEEIDQAEREGVLAP